jgi:acyl-CoA dehydrogenase
VIVVERMRSFLDDVLYPAEAEFAEAGGVSTAGSAVLTRVAHEAQERGLWNVFSQLHPERAAMSPGQLADLAELTGRSPTLAQWALHSLNPDAGVMELLAQLGTDGQRARWLDDLAAGTTSSAYCMTEPGVASSSPEGLATRVELHADDWRLWGLKSWCTGALDPRCDALVVLAVTDPGAPPASRFSLVIARRRDPAVRIGANRDVFGYSDLYRGGHPDIRFEGARVELLGERGQGLLAAQSLLAPARLVHCLRLVGTAERALELMCERLAGRRIKGVALSRNDLWIDRVAECRISVESMRALVRSTAASMPEPVRTSMLKAAVPRQVAQIVDLAIQAYGADGLATTVILAELYAHARSLQISDGPDEVHRRVVGRHELRRFEGAE